MSRFVIVSSAGTSAPAADRFADLAPREQESSTIGCAWLFSAAAGVDDPEGALRAAIREFFASAEGIGIRRREGLKRLGWCEAIPWVPEDLWSRHGLAVFHHPDVERIVLDDEEDLAEDLTDEAGARSRTRAGS